MSLGRLHYGLIFAKLLAPFSLSAVKSRAAVTELLSFDTKIFITQVLAAVCLGGAVSYMGPSILGQLNAHWHWGFVLIVVIFPLSLCLCTAGRHLPYMPYDMMLAMDQEVHSGQPGSPYRLSPRELSKASPQPDPNAPNVSCYSVPPGKSTHLHLLPYPLCLPLPSLPLLIQTSLV